MQDHIELATKLAKNSTHRYFHHGAIIGKGRRILAVGWNKPENHNKMVVRWPHGSDHAEVDCLRQVTRDQAKGTVLYSVRVRHSGTTGNAKPCRMCMSLIKSYGIKRVVYTKDDGQTVIETI